MFASLVRMGGHLSRANLTSGMEKVQNWHDKFNYAPHTNSINNVGLYMSQRSYRTSQDDLYKTSIEKTATKNTYIHPCCGSWHIVGVILGCLDFCDLRRSIVCKLCAAVCAKSLTVQCYFYKHV